MMFIKLARIKLRPVGRTFAGRYVVPTGAVGLLLLSMAVCGGCGFGLAGAGTLAEPGTTATLQFETARPHSEFATTLRDALRINNIRLVDADEQAALVLRVLEDFTGQRVLSVSARNVPREYEVFYTVTFVLEVPGDEPASPQVIAASRNYSYDVNQVLGKSAEEQALRGTLAADLTRRVIRRIQARAGSVPGSVVELPPSGI